MLTYMFTCKFSGEVTGRWKNCERNIFGFYWRECHSSSVKFHNYDGTSDDNVTQVCNAMGNCVEFKHCWFGKESGGRSRLGRPISFLCSVIHVSVFAGTVRVMLLYPLRKLFYRFLRVCIFRNPPLNSGLSLWVAVFNPELNLIVNQYKTH
jgi:hypothetical protein